MKEDDIVQIIKDLDELVELKKVLVKCQIVPDSLLMEVHCKAEQVCSSVRQVFLSKLKVTETEKSVTQPEEDKSRDLNLVSLEDKMQKESNAIPSSFSINSVVSLESVNDLLVKRLATDLSKIFSLNDRFRFQRELFGGDSSLMDQLLEEITCMNDLDTIKLYLEQNFSWDWENETVSYFMGILEKRYH